MAPMAPQIHTLAVITMLVALLALQACAETHYMDMSVSAAPISTSLNIIHSIIMSKLLEMALDLAWSILLVLGDLNHRIGTISAPDLGLSMRCLEDFGNIFWCL